MLSDHARDRWCALLMLAVGWLVVFGGVMVVFRLKGAPYNVREIFDVDRSGREAGLFAALVMWMGFAPAGVGRLIARASRWAAFLPILAALVSAASWMLLRFAVTRESLGDILGPAVLGGSRELELLGRFVALQGSMILVLTVAWSAAARVWARGFRRGLVFGAVLFLLALPWLVLARLVVVNWATTPNLTELIRTEPWPGDIALGVLLLLAAINAAALGWTFASGRGQQTVLALMVTAVLVLPGWWLVNAGLEPAVGRGRHTFPAIRFLLGPNRSTPLAQTALFLRWALVQTAGCLALAWGGAAALRLAGEGRKRATAGPTAAAPVRAGTPSAAGPV